MKHLFKACFFMLLVLIFACDPGNVANSEANDLLVAEAKTTSNQTELVFDGTQGTPGNHPVVGTSTLHRNKNGITVNFKAEEVMPGHAFTLWWVIWNTPEDCVGSPCGADEDFSEPFIFQVDNAGGNVAGNNGKINISGHLNEGGALIDAQTAEVHLVLRSHGPKIPGMVNDQIGSFEGGCVVNFDPFTEVPDEEGECGDIYFSIHIAE